MLVATHRMLQESTASVCPELRRFPTGRDSVRGCKQSSETGEGTSWGTVDSITQDEVKDLTGALSGTLKGEDLLELTQSANEKEE